MNPNEVWFIADRGEGYLVEHQACGNEFIWLPRLHNICTFCGKESVYPERADW